MARKDTFGARSTLDFGSGKAVVFRLAALEEAGLTSLAKLPFSIRILLENVLRKCDGYLVTEDHVRAVAGWNKESAGGEEIPFMPSRVILQDFTGVPAVADLAA